MQAANMTALYDLTDAKYQQMHACLQTQQLDTRYGRLCARPDETSYFFSNPKRLCLFRNGIPTLEI